MARKKLKKGVDGAGKPKALASDRADTPANPHAKGGSPPSPDPAPMNRWIQVGVIFGAALAVRLLYLFQMRDTLIFQTLICDSWTYDLWGQRIASGQWLGTEVFYQTPLYPYFLGSIYSFFGHAVWPVRFAQILFGSLSCVFLSRAAFHLFGNQTAWVAGISLAFYPLAIFFDGVLQKASLDLFFMTALLWGIAATQVKPSWPLFFLIGVILGAVTLNRENAAALFPILVLWILWISWPRLVQVAMPRTAFFVLGVALLLLPVGLRNYYVGGTFALTTSQMGPNFYIGNNAGANGTYETLRPSRGDPIYEALDARLLAEADLKRPLTPGEVSRYWLARSWKYINESPGDWLRLLAWKWYLTWHTVEMLDAESMATHSRHSSVLYLLSRVLSFGIIAPLAAYGIWRTRRDWRRLMPFYLMLLAFAAAITIFYVFSRYRYPLVPILLLFAAAAVTSLWRDLRYPSAGRWREFAIGMPLAALVAISSNWPLTTRFNDSAVTYYNVGTTLKRMGRIDDSIAALKMAVEIDPNMSSIHDGLGSALLMKEEFEKAQREFERAIELDPKDATLHHNLAVALQRNGLHEKSAEHLRRAIELDPLAVESLRALALQEFQQGNTALTVDYLRRVARIDSRSPAAHTDLAIAYRRNGQIAESLAEFRAALSLERKLPIGNAIAWTLATAPADNVRDGREALELATSICESTGNSVPRYLGTLAAAYAENSQFAKAVDACDRAISLSQDSRLTEALRAQRGAYSTGKPWREPRDAWNQ